MQIDPALQSSAYNYKLLTNLIVPRPIAWVTSLNDAGVVNLAPFSFFNAVGSNPVYVVIGIALNDAGEAKDTKQNIVAAGEFVVNMVTEDLLAAMNITAADFPADQSELEAAQLHTLPSVHIKTPRVAESQVSLECKLFSAQPLGTTTLIIGEVVMFHVADHLMGERMHVNDFSPIGRMGSPAVYCRTSDKLNIPRISYAQWSGENNKIL